jgi:hypothetical protein
MEARLSNIPLVCRYAGSGAFEAIGRSKKDADAEYVIGQAYRLNVIEERSEQQHRMYFAALRECWANLPDPHAFQYPNPESLRKQALIRTGYATQRQYVANSRKEAERVAAFVKHDIYELVQIDGNIVTVWTAESQSYRAMGKKRFLESMDAVLGYVAGLIGVDPETLGREAGKAA